ncbi:hypothetical protein NDI76_21665 [Halogeometricum sp. S1BR25-6]|uniref:Uncharacterized protein n=1 Tax=Halogeometricum salsisoli TaxID=2950536 RepID=A0ABU2GM97_9EURY|nr:hypothetical protein [Halogeometricum sp. S1BR25-6]MDS0301344.1 hypothetical protein [Halogeometricum sp. S1BR25-6]
MTKSKIPGNEFWNDPPSIDEEVAKLRLRLNHLSLLELEERELVRWNREKHVVARGSEFDKFQPLWGSGS